MSGVFYYFLFFFKVNSGVFLHNKVATLVLCKIQCISDNAVQEFRNPCSCCKYDYEDVGLMMWAITRDT